VFYVGVIQKSTLGVSQRHRYINAMVTKTVKQTPLQLKITGKTPERLLQLVGICAGMLRNSPSVSRHEATLYSLIVHNIINASVEHLPKQPCVHTITITDRIKQALVKHDILRCEHNSVPGQWCCSWKVTFVSALYLHILRAPWARQ
jgi:hypothetical protein